MATLGSTSQPNDSAESWGLNSKNQYARLFTMPAGGPWKITDVGIWAGGLNMTAVAKVALWTPSGNFLYASAAFTIANEGSLAIGHNGLYERTLLTPKIIDGGNTIYAGWVRDPSDSVQFPLTSGGSHVDHTTSSQPTDIVTSGTHSGTLGVYIRYELANSAPTAPTLTSPSNGSRQTDTTPNLSFTHNDPDDDPISAYQVQVDNNSDFSSVTWDSGKTSTGDETPTVTVGTTLTRGTRYYWRARTWDDSDEVGPWSSSRYFDVNELPVGTKVSPPTSGFPFIHNLASDLTTWTSGGAHAKPRFTWTFSDGDGDAQNAYRVRIYDAASGGTMVHDSGIVSSSSKTYNATWAGIMGTQYWWTLDVRDAYNEWAGESSRTAFKMRWGQAIYEHNPGGTSGSWGFTAGAVAGGTAAFLFRSATGSGGAGAGAWQSSVGLVTPAAWMNVLVRLAPSVAGTNVTLADMTFDYLASSLTPEMFDLEPSSGEWTLDSDVRRFGARSLRCTHGAGSSDRYVWQQVNVTTLTDYAYSGYVYTNGPITGTVKLVITDHNDPSIELDVLYLPVAGATDQTSDTSASADGWERLAKRLRIGSQTEVGVAVVWSGGVTGESIWIDGLQFEESVIPTPWRPGLTGRGVTIDVGGIQIDGQEGAVFRLRGSSATPGSVVELAGDGLTFGDVEVSSPGAGLLDVAGILSSTRVGREVSRVSGTQSISDSTATVVTYDTAVWTDAFTTHSSGSTIIGVAGLYIVSCSLEYPSNATGNWRIIGIGVNNGSAPTTWGGWTNTPQHAFAHNAGYAGGGTRRVGRSWTVPLAVGDRVAVFAYQNSGGSLTIDQCWFSLVRIGP